MSCVRLTLLSVYYIMRTFSSLILGNNKNFIIICRADKLHSIMILFICSLRSEPSPEHSSELAHTSRRT